MGWQRFGLHAVLVLCSVVMLTPMVWLIAATIKGPDDLFHYLFFPSPSRFSLYNFRQLFEQIPYVRFMINSLFVAGATVLVQLFFSSLGGFALAKYEFKGKRLIMVLMLTTMM
ncbi:MAG: hypothetical protein ACPHO6_10855, partial [Candidatus Latescibacterota bacterium]